MEALIGLTYVLAPFLILAASCLLLKQFITLQTWTAPKQHEMAGVVGVAHLLLLFGGILLLQSTASLLFLSFIISIAMITMSILVILSPKDWVNADVIWSGQVLLLIGGLFLLGRCAAVGIGFVGSDMFQ